jgi:GAF domain-containing protein
MSIHFYEPPVLPANEAAREMAVELSGALQARGDKILAEIVQEARRHFEATVSTVSIVHGDAQHVIAADGALPGIYARRLSIAGHAIAADQDIFSVADLSHDQRFAENPWVNGDRGSMRFYAAVLLRDHAGIAIGVLSVLRNKAQDTLIESEQAMLRVYASRVMTRLAALRAELLLPAS